MLDINKVYFEDCLEGMKKIDDKSIDMILCDLPYAKGMGKWDFQIDLDDLWHQYKRIIKDRGAIALFSQNPFSAKLIMSNMSWYKYDWIWDKGKAGNIFTAKLSPMIYHENILIFSNGTIANGSNRNMAYYPQMELLKKPIKYHMGSSKNAFKRESHKSIEYEKTHNYPKSIQYFYSSNFKGKLHPTQKPVELCEYLIKTYSLENGLILDNCMGSGTTAIACLNTNRNFIGFENNEKYYEICINRIENHQKTLKNQ
jgi:site-specific DNA-methyltransferase (adenine-specific)